jgi:hypothetical protein
MAAGEISRNENMWRCQRNVAAEEIENMKRKKEENNERK